MDTMVADPAGNVDARDDEDSGLGEPVAELGGGDEEGGDKLKLETSTPNSNTGEASVWPRVALVLLLQAASIALRSRGLQALSWKARKNIHACLWRN
jgi:hypothetical protein